MAGLARIEAVLLIRGILLLAGLIGGLALFWQFAGDREPLWWIVGWQIGQGQLILSTTALIAGQLAAGRVRRNRLTGLYDSFPTSAGARAGGQFAGLLGALPASLLLIAIAFAVTQFRTPIGSPDVATLAAGALLVVAGGAIGIAIGTRLSHPLAGVVAAMVWLLIYGQSNQFNGTSAWLFPWLRPDQLGNLPHPVVGYPPAVAHALELAGIAVLAVAITLALVSRGARARVSMALVGIVAVAGIFGSVAIQLRPVPTPALDRLFSEAGNPASAQQCSTAGGVRYCFYPGFESLVPALRGPVEAVISGVPSPPARPLTVRQATVLFTDDTSLTDGHSAQQISRWKAQMLAAPQNAPVNSTLYVTVGAWPAGSKLAAARFDLALDTAAWAVGLPASIAGRIGVEGPGSAPAQCVALNQAREAIAIYLALRATHTATAPANERRGSHAFVIDGAAVLAWDYPGEGADFVAPFGLALTDQGYLLARAMTQLPAEKVASALRSAWPTWLDPHTTDAKLAGALEIPLPATPSVPPAPPQAVGHGGGNVPPQNQRCV